MRRPKFLQKYESGDLTFVHNGVTYIISEDDGTVYIISGDVRTVANDSWALANAQLKMEWRNVKNDDIYRARSRAIGAVLNFIFAIGLAVWLVRK